MSASQSYKQRNLELWMWNFKEPGVFPALLYPSEIGLPTTPIMSTNNTISSKFSTFTGMVSKPLSVFSPRPPVSVLMSLSVGRPCYLHVIQTLYSEFCSRKIAWWSEGRVQGENKMCLLTLENLGACDHYVKEEYSGMILRLYVHKEDAHVLVWMTEVHHLTN